MSIQLQPHDQVENRLLAALPSEEYERLHPHLEKMSFALGDVVYESGGQLDHVYFPTTAIVSLLYTMVDLAHRPASICRVTCSGSILK